MASQGAYIEAVALPLPRLPGRGLVRYPCILGVAQQVQFALRPGRASALYSGHFEDQIDLTPEHGIDLDDSSAVMVSQPQK